MADHTGESDASPRRARIRAAEVRRRVLDVAIARVGDLGLTVGFEHLAMDDLIREAEVSRSSTYRLWESKEAFVAELLVEIAGKATGELADAETFDICMRILIANVDAISTVEGRRDVVLEVIRVALAHNYRAVIGSLAWQSYVSLTATLLGHVESAAREHVEAAILSGSNDFILRMAEFHKWFGSMLGFRIRPEWEGDYRPYAVLVSAMVEGLGLRHLSNPQVTDAGYRGPRTVAGQHDDWALASLGLLAVFERFMEEDPDFDLDRTLAVVDEVRREAEASAAADAAEASPQP